MEWIWALGVCFGVVCSVMPGSARNSSIMSPMYLISGPEVVRGGTPTPLAVTILTESSIRVTAQVTQANVNLAQAEDTLQRGSTGILTLPPIPGSSINQSSPLTLVVRGYQRDNLIFTNTTTLRFSNKTTSSFIQTDRSLYRPGDTVKLRIISIQPDNHPYKGRLDHISIRDPWGNEVQRWDSVDGHLGIVSREFHLTQTPPLGRWGITATVNGAINEKSFHVEDHEPPHFEVLVKTASEVLVGDDISGTVKAQHHSGQRVQGTLSISLTLVSALYNSGHPLILDQTKEIHGSTQFLFSKDHLPALHQYSRPTTTMNYNGPSADDDRIVMYINAYVTEISTGLKVNRTVAVHVMENMFQLTFCYFPSVLKPSLHFSTTLKISRYDRKSLSSSDRRHPVLVEVTQRTSEGSAGDELTTMTLSLPEDGSVHMEFRLQDTVEMLLIKATFLSSEETLELYSSNSSPSGSYIQILPINNFFPAQIGSPLQIDVESTFQLDELHYVVSSRGQVVSAGTELSSSFSLNPAVSWSPEACLTVYCVLPDGEVTTDTAHIPIHQRNNVSLSWSSDKARPGDLVTLTVSVLEPRSLVAILVVGMDNDDPVFDQDFKEEKECNIVVLTDARLYETEQPGESEMGDLEEDDLMREQYWWHWMEKGSSDIWLWLDTNVSDSTQTSLQVTVPDRITSWRAVALVMSENLGLGLSPMAQKLTVSKDFSLSLDVPSCLIRGEELVLEVTIFNHLEQDMEAILLVAESEAYEFVLAEQGDVSMVNARKITVGSQDAASALFPIRLLALGEVEIAVDAISAQATESLFRIVLVKPEGVEKAFTKTLFLELAPRERNLSRTVSFSFPPDVVVGSQRAHVAVVGDILALSIEGLESLVQMPHGCGEQNMIHFAPSVYVLQYLLTKSSQDNEMLKTRALGYMMQGYQRELSYLRDDGSFSAFGASDPSGSTWLTAFVLRSFLQAQPFMQVDQSIISRAISWLLGHQRPQGEFTEVGRVIHTELQGGMEDGPVALTAYVLTALLEDQTYIDMFPGNVSMARGYLESRVSSGIVSNYSLCLVAYALALANSPVAATALDELSRRADNIDGIMRWTASGGQGSNGEQPTSAQIEMAAYVVLALYKRASMVEGIDLMKWLCQQINYLGGLGTTQNTVVALKALAGYAAFSGANAIDLRLKIDTSPSGSAFHLSINSTTYLMYQDREINAEGDLLINVSMEGRGFALLQMNVFYNWDRSSMHRHSTDHQAFSLNVDVFDSERDLNHILLSICTRLLENQGIAQTGMAMVEVGLLSGFTLAPEASAMGDLIRKVERSPGKISLYLDSLNTSEVCISIPMMRDFRVARVQDATVWVYDYYEPTRRALRTYNSDLMHNIDSCAFCGSDCSRCRAGITIIVSSSSSHSISSATYSLGCLLAAITAFLL